MKRTLLKSILNLAVAALLVPAAFAKTDALSLVPADAVSVGVVRLAEIRTGALAPMLMKHTNDVTSSGEADHFLRDAGLEPTKDIDVLVVSTSPRTTLGSEAEVLVGADGRFNPERLTAALVTRGAEKKITPNGAYYILPEARDDAGNRGAVAFPDSKLVLAGSERAVTRALADRALGGGAFLATGGLAHDLNRIDMTATAWAIVDVARAKRFVGSGPDISNDKAPGISSALKYVSTIGLWAKDTGDALKVSGIGIGSDSDTLQLLEDTLRGGLAALRLAAQDKAPQAVSILRKFDVGRTNDSVSISGTIPVEMLRNLMSGPKQRAAAR